MQLEMHDREGSDEARAIQKGLTDYNSRFYAYNHRDLTVYVRGDGGEVAAGLVGSTNWGWLYVRLLWVGEGLRSQGLGAKLLEAAEEEARRRGCRAAWLDTFSFQARGFYEKRGYALFGELPEFPAGHSRHFLTKRL